MSRLGGDAWRWPVRLSLPVGLLLLVTAPILRMWLTPALAQAPLIPPGGAATFVETGTVTALFDLDTGAEAQSQPVPDVAITITQDPGSGCPAMERTPGVVRLEEAAVRIAGELGFPLKGAATGGGSDISFAGHAGTPGLDGLGPIGGLDHGPDEYVVTSSVAPRTALLAKLMMEIRPNEG